MLPRFETFDKAQAPFTKEPHITIQRRGTLTLNAASYRLLASPAAVELLYDPADQILGLRPIGEDAAHAVFVRPSTRSARGPWVISAMAFIHHYGIDTTDARRWIAHLDGGVLIARLGDRAEVVSRDVRQQPARPERPSTTHRPRPRPTR